MASLLPVLVGSAATPAGAVPGVPAAPTTIFTENFENVPNNNVVMLNNYVGANGTTYTADSTWINGPACNGVIAAFNSPWPGGTFCGAENIFNIYVRGTARALGNTFGGGDNNQVLVDTTANTNVSAATTPAPLLQTATNAITLPGPNRFIAFSVDVSATSCDAANDPLLRFYLLQGGTQTQLNAISPCSDPRGSNVTVTTPSGAPGTYRVGRYTTNTAVLVPGTQMGLKITNDEGDPVGNDFAIDNIQVLDVTPTLDKSFGSAPPGAPAALTFTITNTSDLLAKPGWSFTDTLSPGLTVASPSSASTTCGPTTTITGVPGSSTIQVTGSLSSGTQSCTVSVNVLSTGAGPFTNGPGNVSLSGLNPPRASTLTPATIPCNISTVYYAIDNPTQLNTARLGWGNLNLQPVPGTPTGDTYNALGWNPLDGYLYAISDGGHLVRVDPRTGQVTDLGATNPVLPINTNVGAFDAAGNYYVMLRGSAPSTGLTWRRGT